jgi:hypothetical protein
MAFFLFIFYEYPTVPPRVKLLNTPGPDPIIEVRIVEAMPLHVSVDPCVLLVFALKGANAIFGVYELERASELSLIKTD